MRALWLESQKLAYIGDAPIPEPGPGEALIKVLLSGVCSTDLELVHGYYPFTGIPGHEFVGQVVSVQGESSWIGKRVVGEINITCGQCRMCKRGLPRHCEQRKTLGIHDWNGAFAEFLVLPVSNLHAVPPSVPDEAAVFTEPLAAAYEILEQTTLEPEEEVLVIGAGRLGQLVAGVIKQAGCHPDVLAKYEKQHSLLAEVGINAFDEQELGQKKYDVVVEATGSAAGFNLASQCIRPRGRIVLKSTYRGNVEVDFSRIVVDEVTLIGSRCGEFEPALNLLASGCIDPTPLIDSIHPLEAGLEAFKLADTAGVLKVLIKP